MHFVKKSMTVILALVILLLLVLPVMAQENRAAPGNYMATSSSQGQGPTDPAEMEAFLDELMAKDMEAHHIAGAAISVVKDGEVFFAKGYGYADLENGIPVDPELTLFKIGSVTKLFTWTAVMQLMEQGKLDLDADINSYLDFRIPDTYPQPITLKHLMAHSAGFEDQHVDMVARRDEALAPQREWLVSHIPARVRPPGEVPAYSNYGAALAGYIVAQVSGETYSQYIQNHILDPLDMNGSTAFGQTPPDLIERESVGYMDETGVIKVFPYITGPLDLYPAGVIRATVADMARFMLAHLQGGFYGDAHTEVHILEEATARQMHSTLYAPEPRLLGNAYGFFEFSDNGQRVIGHSGEAEPMQSALFLLPDQELGVFVVYNSMGGGALTSQHLGFQRAFFDHYYPTAAVEPIKKPADFAQRADRFVGAYRWTQNSSTTLEKYTSQLFGYAIRIENPGDGTLLLVAPWGEMPFVEEEPLYFRLVDGPFHIAFREDNQGRVAYLFTDFTPQFAFEKVEWYETIGFNMPLLLTSILMFLSVIPVALIRSIRNRRTKEDQRSTPRSASVAYRLIVGISILNLLFVAGTFMWGEQIMFGIPLIYKFVMGLGVLSAVLTIGALVYMVLAWKDGYWSMAFRAYYTMMTVAASAFIWFLNYWNLLGWRF